MVMGSWWAEWAVFTRVHIRYREAYRREGREKKSE